MHPHKNRGTGFLIGLLVFTVALILAWALFFPVRSLLNTHAFGIGHDAAKNVFTPYYHVAHDSSYWHFQGMNYPLGEQVTYTDNQPLITNILKWAGGFLPIKENFLLIFNMILLLGIPLASLLVFILLSKLKLPFWYASLVSITVVFLSPQMMRFTGHYSLGHLWVFPLVILLIYLFLKRPCWAYSIIQAFVVLLLGFIHPYLLFISGFMIFCLLGSDLLLDKLLHDRIDKRKAMLALGQTILPVMLFFAIIKFTDPVSDRPDDPYGLLVYRVPFFSMMLPVEFPWFKSLGTSFKNEYIMEQTAYFGLFAILGMVFMVGHVMIVPRRWVRAIEGSVSIRFIYLCFWGALVTMIAAQAIPFIYDPSGRFLEWLGPLRQFRGLGRFSLASFYLVNIAAAGFFGRKLFSSRHKGYKLLFGFLMLVLATESFIWASHIREKLAEKPYALLGSPLQNINPGNYQAILSLPYTHIGSENFRTSENIEVNARAFQVSAQTGLPMLNVIMSRTSYGQTRENLRLVSHLAENPCILHLMEKEPILIVADTGAIQLPFERQLISHADFLYADTLFQYFLLQVETFTDIHNSNQSSAPKKAMTALKVTWEATARLMIYRSFDEMRGGVPFHGNGSLATVRNHATVLFKGSLPPGEYELSFWFLTTEQQSVNTQFAYSEKSKTGDVLRFSLHEVADLRFSFLGDWMLATYQFKQTVENSDIEIFLYREGPRIPLVIDEVLLRPVSMDVKTVSDTLNLNNRYYP